MSDDIKWDINEAIEIVNNAKNNSIKNKKDNMDEPNYKKDRKKVSAKELGTKVVTLFLVGAIVVTGAIHMIKKGKELVEDLTDLKEKAKLMDEFTSEYQEIVSKHTHRTSDNQGYWYDTHEIGKAISEKENVDEALFGVFKCVNYDSSKHMDEIIGSYNAYTYTENEKPLFSGFDDYLTKKGFVDEFGKPSITKYEEQMSNMVWGKGFTGSITEQSQNVPKGK